MGTKHHIERTPCAKSSERAKKLHLSSGNSYLTLSTQIFFSVFLSAEFSGTYSESWAQDLMSFYFRVTSTKIEQGDPDSLKSRGVRYHLQSWFEVEDDQEDE